MVERTYSDDVWKFCVADSTIIVQVKIIVNSSELLGWQENTHLGEHLIEFELFQNSISILVKLLETKKIIKHMQFKNRDKDYQILTLKTFSSLSMLSQPLAKSCAFIF